MPVGRCARDYLTKQQKEIIVKCYRELPIAPNGKKQRHAADNLARRFGVTKEYIARLNREAKKKGE